MKSFYELRFFLILWLTQAFSSLGSAMTNFALVLWLYQDSGSALKTAMLTVCSYAPYVLLSLFTASLFTGRSSLFPSSSARICA